MRHTRGRAVEVTDLEDLDRRLAAGASSLEGWHVQGLDLRGRSAALRGCRAAGALFLGCRFAPGDEDALRAAGAVVFPEVPGVPVDVYRGRLYDPHELYDTLVDGPAGPADHGYAASLDARAYGWSQQHADRETMLAQALHDHAVDAALADWVRGRHVVGVMGGHALRRGEPGYREAARLGAALAAYASVATGGGPGAMEAASLGAWLAGGEQGRAGGGALDAVLAEAVDRLAAVPSYQPSIGAWALPAMAVRDAHPSASEVLSVPTWHYGHEPPHVFASAVAKYFRNSAREAVLLEVCDAGIVFLPGAAGTVQEVFQDACENYYADESSLAPMVLLGARHWTEEVPAWPLLHRLARDRAMAAHVHLVDSVEEAAAVVAAGA